MFVFLAAVLAANLVPEQLSLQVGDIAPRDIKANRQLINPVETQRRQQQAADQVQPVYDNDASVLENALARTTDIFDTVATVRERSGSVTTKIEVLARELSVTASNEELRAVLQAAPETLGQARAETEAILHRVLEGTITQESLDTARRLAATDAKQQLGENAVADFVAAVVTQLVEPNAVFNQAETLQRRQEAMANVEPVRILKGQIIIQDGQPVTHEQIEILRAAGLLDHRSSYKTVVGAVLLSLLLAAFVTIYLFQFRRRMFQNERQVATICLVVIVATLLSLMVKSVSGYLMPVGAATMLLTILLGPQVALVTGTALGLFLGMLTGNDLGIAVVAIMGGAVGVFAVSRTGQRSTLTWAGVQVGMANALVIVGLNLLAGNPFSQLAAWKEVMWGMVNGVLSVVLTLGSLPFFEGFFGIITSFKLLELSNPNQPLLRRLLLEAPGTYHHSIIVGNMAEAAAESVGANPLLARVGAHYHDIGKLKRPFFFVENQFGGENPHQKIAPSLSALIITAHVKDGADMARDYGLPQAVIDIIRQHHGSTLVSYFYCRATENGHAEAVDESAFRYDGPLPESKEAAIVMLADSAEAAVRSLNNPTKGRIEGMVRRLTKERLDDGQLDRSDLTLRDLDAIARSFVAVLSGIFHPRIEYPDMIKEVKGRTKEEKGKDESLDGEEGGHDAGPAGKPTADDPAHG
jgi:putative nucleotidyltransferase with HDIG domain